MNNDELSKLLINCILKKQTSKINIGDVLKRKEFFTREDVGITSVVQKYLSSLFTNNLSKLLFKLEKDNFLSTFIFNQKFPDFNQPLIIDNKNEEQDKKKGPKNENNQNNKEAEEEKKLNKNEEKNEIKEEKNEIVEEKKEEKNEIVEDKKEEKNEIVIEKKEEKN